MINNSLIKDKIFLTTKYAFIENKVFDMCSNAQSTVFETDLGPEEPKLGEFKASRARKRINILIRKWDIKKIIPAFFEAKSNGCPLYIYFRGCC